MSVQPILATKPSLTLKRQLKAKPDKVYAAWTDAEKVLKWFGPDKIDVLSAEADARPGGRFHIVMLGADREEHDVSGTYLEVVPNEKLVFTWAWRTTPERQSLVTVLIRREGSGSMLTLIHEQFFDEAARDRHREGWSGCLDKLEKYLA
jgi:uncharacterized protein YndB with AHSA1/START domain